MIRLPVIVAAALVAAPSLRAADRLPPELALVPTDAAAFVSIRADLLTGTGPGKAGLLGDLLRQPDVVKEFETNLVGSPPAEVERVTAVYPTLPVGDVGERPPAIIVTRTKPIDRAALIRKLEAWPFPDER